MMGDFIETSFFCLVVFSEHLQETTIPSTVLVQQLGNGPNIFTRMNDRKPQNGIVI